MTELPDLGPVAQQIIDLLDGISDDQLDNTTPCAPVTLGQLLDHISGLSVAFTAAAGKDLGPLTSTAPDLAAGSLAPDWRTGLPQRLSGLALAWRDPQAWEGMTQAGNVDLPGAVAGRVAMNELVIHGWDVARSSGQEWKPDPQALAATTQFVEQMSEPGQEAGREGLFGPVMPVPPGATELDRVIALSGRDPQWSNR